MTPDEFIPGFFNHRYKSLKTLNLYDDHSDFDRFVWWLAVHTVQEGQIRCHLFFAGFQKKELYPLSDRDPDPPGDLFSPGPGAD
jgi:hypothetical protein